MVHLEGVLDNVWIQMIERDGDECGRDVVWYRARENIILRSAL